MSEALADAEQLDFFMRFASPALDPAKYHGRCTLASRGERAHSIPVTPSRAVNRPRADPPEVGPTLPEYPGPEGRLLTFISEVEGRTA